MSLVAGVTVHLTMTLHPLESYARALHFIVREVLSAGKVAAGIGCDDRHIGALLVPGFTLVRILKWLAALRLIVLKLVALLPVDRMALSPGYRYTLALLEVQN